MKIKLLFILLSVTCFHFIQAQITFQKTYGTPKNDYGCSIAQTFDGGYIISAIYDSNQTAIIKTDSVGDTTWIRTYPYLIPSGGEDYVIQTSDSNYVLVGGCTDSTAFILKVNSVGDTLWLRKHHYSSYMDTYFKVAEDKSSNLVVVGETFVGTSSVCCRPILTKMNSTGSAIWSKSVNCPSSAGCRLEQIYIDMYDGKYLVTGDGPGSIGPPSAWLVKVDTSGKSIWNSAYVYPSTSITSIISAPDSGYVCSGQTWGPDSLPLFKFDKKGNLKVYKALLGATGATSIDTAKNGYFLGYSTAGSAGKDDYFLSKLDTNFNIIWSQNYGGPQNDECALMKTTKDGGAILVGNTQSFGAGESDVYVVKTDDKGFITGQNIISIAQNGISISPNPFAETTLISSEKYFSNATLTLYNSLGQSVRTLNGLSGKEFVLNRDNLPDGIYLIRLTQGSITATAKILVQN